MTIARQLSLKANVIAALALFVIALAPRVGFVVMKGVPALTSDSEHYLVHAQTVREHFTLGRDADHPSAIDHVTYILFLALFGASTGTPPLTALIGQCLLAAACASLAYWLGLRLGGRWAAWGAGLFCAFYTPTFVYPWMVLTETHACFGLLVVLLVMDRALESKGVSWSLVGGASFALLALTRMPTLPLCLVGGVFLALRSLGDWRRLALSCSAFAVAFSLVYGCWIVRNTVTLGRPIVMRERGAPTAGGAHEVAQLIREGHSLIEARSIAAVQREERRLRGDTSTKNLSRMSPVYWRDCSQRLAIMLGLHPNVEAPYPLTGTTVDFFPPLRWFNYAWHYLVLAGSAVALGVALWRRDIGLLHALAVPWAMVFVYAAVGAIPRFQIPLFCAMSVSAGIGIGFAAERMTRRVGQGKLLVKESAE